MVLIWMSRSAAAEEVAICHTDNSESHGGLRGATEVTRAARANEETIPRIIGEHRHALIPTRSSRGC